MPEEKYAWLPKEEILRFEEISLLVDVFCSLGVNKLRLTGGEPLLRQNLSALVAMLAKKSAVQDLALTTNGVFLPEQAHELRAAGLQRVTISLDTLQRDRFLALTRRDQFDKTIEGIAAAKRAGFASVKINTVAMRGVNDDELIEMLRFAREQQCELRFIEYMDVGGATQWSNERVVSQREILATLAAHFGPITPEGEQGSSPAESFLLADGTRFGVIASTTLPFCGACDRSRLTADGTWYKCLYAKTGTDLRKALRQGLPLEELQQIVKSGWRARSDRGAEERLALQQRGPLMKATELQQDPRLEMHTRGG